MKETIIFITIVILIGLNSCSNPTSPPPAKELPKAVKLKLVDVSCTEAFINVIASDTLTVLPVNITLNKDAKVLFNFTLTKTDTTIIDTALQAGKSYIYQTIAVIKGEEQKSDTLQVKTLDTTSHNFTWQTFTFGDPDAGSSEINDVAIISENNIWCVGEINVIDSSENGYITYNAVHWNGSKWELKTIMFPLCDGNGNQNGSGPFIANSVFAFSAEDIWITCDVSLVHWDGQKFNPVCMPIGYGQRNLTKIWGLNKELYLIGTNGFIAHYQNEQWSKIESGTKSDIREIWGAIEPISGTLKILATESAINNYNIITLTSSSTKDTLNWPNNKSLSGIWLDGRRTYVGGTDIWINKNNSWQQVTSTGYFFTRVKGTLCNNIYGIGPDGTVHFNGSIWQIIKPRPEGLVMVSGDCSNNVVILVGFASSGGVVGKAAVLMGVQVK
ncbi:MAG: hypothetical protein WAM24_16530 [Ignavibacteriaceae bacterium]